MVVGQASLWLWCFPTVASFSGTIRTRTVTRAATAHFKITELRPFGSGGIWCRSSDGECLVDLFACSMFSSLVYLFADVCVLLISETGVKCSCSNEPVSSKFCSTYSCAVTCAWRVDIVMKCAILLATDNKLCWITVTFHLLGETGAHQLEH